jgi:hypothetical protein
MQGYISVRARYGKGLSANRCVRAEQCRAMDMCTRDEFVWVLLKAPPWTLLGKTVVTRTQEDFALNR